MDKRWGEINGKQIKWVDKSGNVYDAFVIAAPNKGITIKPLNPDEIKDGSLWSINPQSPDFYFLCFRTLNDIHKKWGLRNYDRTHGLHMARRYKIVRDNMLTKLNSDKKIFDYMYLTNGLDSAFSGKSCPFS